MRVTKKKIFISIQLISISRALSGLLFVCIALREELRIFASILFLYACFSDLLDGFLARKYSCTSNPGKILDLFGDKFLTIAASLFAIAKGMPMIPISFIVFREVFLLAIRSINQTEIFPPQRTLGAITVMPIWITTFLLVQTPIIININESYFIIFYWICGSFVMGNLIYKLTKSWKVLLKEFEKHI